MMMLRPPLDAWQIAANKATLAPLRPTVYEDEYCNIRGALENIDAELTEDGYILAPCNDCDAGAITATMTQDDDKWIVELLDDRQSLTLDTVPLCEACSWSV